MRIACHTGVWGPRIDDLDAVLEIVAAAGFEGVEISQRPGMLGPAVDSMDALMSRLERFGLVLVALDGGSLEERMLLCGGVRSPFLVVEDWDPIAAPRATAAGFNLALSSRAFTQVGQLQSVVRLLEEHPKLKWLPDTAQLFIAGEDPIKALDTAPERLLGVHLQDWNPSFGRTPRRYTRGLMALGEGALDLRRIISALKEKNFSGWLVAKQAATTPARATSVFRSAGWLADHGLMAHPREGVRHPSSQFSLSVAHHTLQSAQLSAALLRASGQTFDQCCQSVVEACRIFGQSNLATLWDYNPEMESLGMLSSDPPVTPSMTTFSVEHSLAATVIALQKPVHFDLTVDEPGGRFGRQLAAFDLAGAGVNGQRMLSIPIFDPLLRSSIQYIVNLLMGPSETIPENDWEQISIDVARALDCALERSCGDATSAVATLSGATGVDEIAKAICSLVARLISCEGATLFLVSPATDELLVAASTGITWRTEERQSYHIGEGLTGRVWQLNKSMLFQNARSDTASLGKSFEVTQGDSQDVMLLPVRSPNGACIGVLRCRGRRNSFRLGPQPFTLADVAVVESMLAVAAPQIHFLATQARQEHMIVRMVHELMHPVVTIRTAANLLQTELRQKNTVLHNDYLGDILSYADLMLALVTKTDLVGRGAQLIPLNPTPTLLIRDVIAPVVRQIRPLLVNKGFGGDRILYKEEELRVIPSLFVDRRYFQQVFFNLLSNSIKYSFHDPKSFHVEIGAERAGKEYKLFIRDWGMGIPPGLEDAVFREGFRAPSAVGSATGDGLGLWVVRRLIEAHGGGIRVSNRHLPTEFTIVLPSVLTRLPRAEDA
jgi:signal transduction histidine kinase/sugar phosphate isomerase/epimerase